MTALPKVFRVRQNFKSEQIRDLPLAVSQALERLRPLLTPGSVVAVGAGSRGISNIAEIIRATCDVLIGYGTRPFIIPAMGSHGGATAEGQRHVLESYGITEEAMGVPIRASMEVVELGRTSSGIQVFLDRHAAEADFILPVNRVKPHTDFRGDNESGIVKMTAVGLGKLAGAKEYHHQAYHLGHARVFREVASVVLSTGKIPGGLAIIENSLHETSRLAAVHRDNYIAEDQELLREARRLMPRLPCEEVDLLIVDEIGKNLSGTGMDTNIIGRSVNGYLENVPTHDTAPRIRRILVRDLTTESAGNGIGIGLADFTTARFMDKLNVQATVINGLTAMTPMNARLPVHFGTDREAIEMGLKTAGVSNLSAGRVVRIKNTLSLNIIEMSDAYLDEVKASSHLTVTEDSHAMNFDEQNNLKDFDR
jgi:hypothetical protein